MMIKGWVKSFKRRSPKQERTARVIAVAAVYKSQGSAPGLQLTFLSEGLERLVIEIERIEWRQIVEQVEAHMERNP